MNKTEMLTNLFQNEEFKKDAAELTTAEELQALISRYGVALSMDEVHNMCGQIAQQMNQDELTEEDLENVSGGFTIIGSTLIVLKGAKAVVFGVACIGALALGIWNGYNSNKKG